MTRNVGRIDQFIRMVVGLVIIAYMFKDGAINSMWPVFIPIALIMIGTAFFSFCPLYAVVGWNTAKRSARPS